MMKNNSFRAIKIFLLGYLFVTVMIPIVMLFSQIKGENIENVIERIGKDWMLICTRDEENGRTNAMTASWGAMGVLWNKNICICFVRPERHTHKLLGENETFSIAFMGEMYREALRFCGKES